MATFTGTGANETITPTFVSPTVSASGGAAPSDQGDSIDGGGGTDIIDSGGGSDFVTGGTGDDQVALGAGFDRFSWFAGDGSDVVDGGADSDDLFIIGSSDAELYDLALLNGRLRITRDVGNSLLDTVNFEFINLTAGLGADTVVVHNLLGSNISRVTIDLDGPEDFVFGDGFADRVAVDGRTSADEITISRFEDAGSLSSISAIGGLGPQTLLFGVEPEDQVIVNGFGGDDLLQAQPPDFITGFAAVNYKLALDGGTGNDTLKGGAANDTLIGGEGNDVVTGGLGNDTVRLGTGNDVYFHSQNSGFDTLEGGFNFDRLVYGTVGDLLISRVGQRVLFEEDTGLDILDMAGVESIEIDNGGFGGSISVGDLSGTGVTRVRIDAKASQVEEGGRQTSLFVGSTAGNDVVTVSSVGTKVTIAGLPWLIEMLDAAPENSLQLGTGNGNDRLDMSGLEIAFKRSGINLGIGDDVLIAGVGAEEIQGDTGTDTVIYSGSAFSVAVDLATGSGLGGDAQDDSYSGIENVTGSAFADIIGGDTESNVITGGGGDDQLFGRGGGDTLVGGTGIDRTDGGTGDDTHRVDNGADIVVERVGEGNDTVLTSVSYALTDAMHVEILNAAVATATTPISLTGNVRGNSLTGNSGANLLDGGGGADTMRGGRGNDIYVVDNGEDKAIESSATGGTDTVRSSVTFVLGANLENLTLTGAATANGTGNEGANTLVGNIANNVLRGGPGVDKLSGDRGADTLSGGRGNDSLTGGGGADDFLFDSALGSAANVDRLEDFGTGADRILLDRSVFTGIAANGTLDASAFALGTAAGDSSDRILYDSGTGRIFYDADGTGSAASPIHFATIDAATPLSSANFVAVLG